MVGSKASLALLISCLVQSLAPRLGQAAAQVPQSDGRVVGEEAAMPVTIDNYVVAESDTYMAKFVLAGALGKFLHKRNMTEVDTRPASAPTHGQAVIRMNRDTLYSAAVLDLSSPATLTFPSSAGGRFVSLMVGSENHDIFPMQYEPGLYEVTQNGCGCGAPPCWSGQAPSPSSSSSSPSPSACFAVGTSRAFVLLRTQANPTNPSDLAAAHAVQDGFTIEQASVGHFGAPRWNLLQLLELRKTLKLLRGTSSAPPVFGFFTGPERIDRLDGTLCVATTWGGARPEDQTYSFWSSGGRSGGFTLTMPKVPAAMWSVTVYNKQGYMFALPANYNSKNNEGHANTNENTTVFFGNCDDPARQVPSPAHCLPTEDGWGLLLRFFRPGPEILSGHWQTPYPEPDQRQEEEEEEEEEEETKEAKEMGMGLLML